jgi:hypothetical protein
MPFYDIIYANYNTCNLTSFGVTPGGRSTGAGGQFVKTLSICAPACCSSGACTTGCMTGALQLWSVDGYWIGKSLLYICDSITSDGH